MNDFRLKPDDPRLTAYALGELDADECAAVEAALRDDPAARAVVEEIRATAARLEDALAVESETETVASVAEASAADHAVRPPVDEYRRSKRGTVGQMLQFPQVYYVVGGLAAACFAVVAVLRTPRPEPKAGPIARGIEPAYVRVPITFAPAEKTGDEDQSMKVSVPVAPRTPAPTAIEPVSTRIESVVEALRPPPATGPVEGAAANRIVVLPARNASGELARSEGTLDARSNRTVFSAEDPARTTAVPGGSTEQAREITANRDTLPAVATVEPEVRPVAEAIGRSEGDTPGAAVSGAVAVTVPEPKATPPSPDAKTAAPVTIGGPDGGKLATRESATANGRPLPARVAATKSGLAPTAAESEVVTLSAFKVSSERGRGAEAIAGPPPAAGRRNGLPPPPAGVKLAVRGASLGGAPDNDFNGVEENPRSRIPAVVDTSSYQDIRRLIESGRLPTRDMVRIEELVNHFPYRYAPPAGKEDLPFAAALEVAEAPWAPTHRLVRIALKGREPSAADRMSAIANDVRIEVEFNPEKVSSYRLIGYENPRFRREEFSNDRPVGVDVMASQAVTALYEIVPVGAEERRVADKPAADDLRYQRNVVTSSRLATASADPALINELLLVTVHYRKPNGLFNLSRRQDIPLPDTTRAFAEASADFKFVAAVAQFGMILRGSPHRGNATIGDVLAWAAAGAGSNADDPRGHRGDFIGLVRKAQPLLR